MNEYWEGKMKHKWIILIAIALTAFVLAGAVKAQSNDCTLLVYNDDDEEGYYDELFFTDNGGREICKVRLYFHDAPPEESGAVFTESGTVNGYSANFDGSSVHVWRNGSPYSISHSKIWVRELPTTDEPPPPDTSTPTPVTPTSTATPNTPTVTNTATITPTLPPDVTPSPTPTVTITLTTTPTMTGTLPTPFITETPPNTPDTPPVSYPPPMLPETGGWGMNNFGIWFAIGLMFGLIALFVGIVRRR